MTGLFLTGRVGRSGVLSRAEFAHCGQGLRVGGDVKLRGVLVGRIEKIQRLDGGSCLVTYLLEHNSIEQIPANVGAQIRAKTIFGEKWVELLFPSDPSEKRIAQGDTIPQDRTIDPLEVETILNTALPLLDAIDPEHLAGALEALAAGFVGHEDAAITGIEKGILALRPLNENEALLIPIEQTTIPVSTQALLSTLEAVLRGVPPEDLKGAVDALGIGLTGRGPDLATIIESSATLAELFAERSPEVQGLLRNGTRVGAAFLKSRKDFAKAIHELVTVSESLSDGRGDLERLLKGTNITADELVRLLRENRPAVNQFLREFGEVNELQAEHAGDINSLFLHLPTALDKVVGAFEPSTGLVRFGLVSDNENPACSYGTARRRPADRSNNLPPKSASCGGSTASRSGSPGSASGADPGSLPGVDSSSVLDGAADDLAVPRRMSEWSWTLFYLRGIQ